VGAAVIQVELGHLALGSCGRAAGDTSDKQYADCAYIAVGSQTRFSVGRGWQYGSPRFIARGPDDYTADNQYCTTTYSFGSWQLAHRRLSFSDRRWFRTTVIRNYTCINVRKFYSRQRR
jgi:hypothetical protein